MRLARVGETQMSPEAIYPRGTLYCLLSQLRAKETGGQEIGTPPGGGTR